MYEKEKEKWDRSEFEKKDQFKVWVSETLFSVLITSSYVLCTFLYLF